MKRNNQVRVYAWCEVAGWSVHVRDGTDIVNIAYDFPTKREAETLAQVHPPEVEWAEVKP